MSLLDYGFLAVTWLLVAVFWVHLWWKSRDRGPGFLCARHGHAWGFDVQFVDSEGRDGGRDIVGMLSETPAVLITKAECAFCRETLTFTLRASVSEGGGLLIDMQPRAVKRETGPAAPRWRWRSPFYRKSKVDG